MKVLNVLFNSDLKPVKHVCSLDSQLVGVSHVPMISLADISFNSAFLHASCPEISRFSHRQGVRLLPTGTAVCR
jgi:hypothetical protein